MKCNLSIAIRYQVGYGCCFFYKPLVNIRFFPGRSATPVASDNRVGERYAWPWSVRKPARHSHAVNRGSPPCLLPDVHSRTRPHSTTNQTGGSREVLCQRRRASFCWINICKFYIFWYFANGQLTTQKTIQRLFYLLYLRYSPEKDWRERHISDLNVTFHIQNSLFEFIWVGVIDDLYMVSGCL